VSTASGVITLKIREWSKITKITRILVAAMQPPCILVILVIKLSKNQQLSALLFADDQVITADREDNLQSAAHKLNQIITEYGLTISVQKTKSMAFRGRDPVRTKTVIDNKIIEQVNSFNYLGNMISYEKELDFDNKIHNYLKITGILNNVFRPQKNS